MYLRIHPSRASELRHHLFPSKLEEVIGMPVIEDNAMDLNYAEIIIGVVY